MTDATVYFENACAAIAEHPDGYVLFTYRPGKRSPAQLATLLERVATLLEIHGWHRILNDQRLMDLLTPMETTQAVTFWRQRTRAWGHGLCVASVLAHDVFARLAATSVRQELRSAGLGYRLFDKQEEAGAWLRQQTSCPPLT